MCVCVCTVVGVRSRCARRDFCRSLVNMAGEKEEEEEEEEVEEEKVCTEKRNV